MTAGCGAPDQGVELPVSTDLSKETVLAGRVVAGGQPVAGAFVRLLDGTGEFTAEVVASPLPARESARSVHVPGAAKNRKSPDGEAVLTAGGPGLHRAEVAVG